MLHLGPRLLVTHGCLRVARTNPRELVDQTEAMSVTQKGPAGEVGSLRQAHG